MQFGLDTQTAQSLVIGLIAGLAAVPLAYRSFTARRRAGAGGSGSRNAVYSHEGLMAHGGELLARTRRDGRPLSLAVFDCSDLLEARRIYDRETSSKLLALVVSKLTSVAGKGGMLACTSPAQFTVLLPAGKEDAVQAIKHVLGSPARIELEYDDGEIVLIPSFMVEAVAAGGSLEKVYAHVADRLAIHKSVEQRRLSAMKRERERHSRPAPLMIVPDTPVAAARMPLGSRVPQLDAFTARQQIPPTIPMPLSMR
jgi:GGDEF domain-containing protein